MGPEDNPADEISEEEYYRGMAEADRCPECNQPFTSGRRVCNIHGAFCSHPCIDAATARGRAKGPAEEIARLREALRPFAAYVGLRGSGMPDETLMDSVLPDGPTLGDCRRAASALGVPLRVDS